MESIAKETTPSRFVIAIDGPAGAGKSTIAKNVAQSLGFVRIDTGAMYRAVALFVLEGAFDPDDEVAATEVAQALELRFHGHDEPTLFAGTRALTDALRTVAVAQAASRVSVHTGVRTAMTAAQRNMGATGCVVLEGRDIGTVVFPDADLKVFLTASDLVRAQRRAAELAGQANAPSYETILAEIRERDARDQNRPTAPLRAAADAIWIDSSALSLEAVTTNIVDSARARFAR